MKEESMALSEVKGELVAMRQRITELETLHRTSLQLTSSLDPRTVLRRVAENVLALVGASDCLIYLFDAASDAFTFSTALGRWAEQDTVIAPRPHGLTATVVREGEAVVINDAVGHPLYASAKAQAWGIQAIAGLPLRWAGRMLGVLHVVCIEPHTFSEEELRALDLLADQAAVAIGNAQLYAQAQQEAADGARTVEALQKHRDHLEALVQERAVALIEANAQLQQEVAERKQAEAEREHLLAAERAQARLQAALFRLSAELAATLDETEVCRRVVNGLRDTLGYDFVALFMLDETTRDRVLAASVGFVDPPSRLVPGQGLSERPLLDGQLHYTPDVNEEPYYFYGMQGSEVDVPLRIGGQVLGVLVAESKQRDAFDQDDFEVLTAAAQQAGLAIEAARLLAAERQRADELEALHTTMADVTAELELSALLQAIVERATALVDATGGELGLYDEANQEIRIVVSHNLGQDYVGTRHRLGEGAMGCVAETGEALIIDDYHTWERRAPQYTAIQMRASIASPLKVGGRLVGIITLATTDPERKFGPPDLHLLSLFAHQAAIAINNARLYADLSASQGYARNIIDSSLDPIIAVDKERRIVEFNAAAQDTFGYDREEILGQHVDALYAERQEGLDIHQMTVAQGRCIQEVLNTRKNGELFPSILSASLLYDAQGEMVGVMGISRDITERKRAEGALRNYQERLEELVEGRTAELRESEARYRTLFDGIPIGLYRSTPAGEMLDANMALVEMYGYPSREELLKVDSTVSFYVDAEDRVRWKALIEQAGVVRDFEAQARCYDGAVVWTNDTARAVRDEQGRVLYYEGSVEDITERKQAEEELRNYREHLEELVEERTAELRESEERYRTLFDGVPVGLYRTTPDGDVLDANLATAQMFGYPNRDEVLSVLNTADVYVDPEERARWQALMEREGIVRDFEERVRKYDGTIMWLNDTARAVKDEQGQVLYYEGSLEDITERKKLEEEIRRQKDYFEALFLNNPVAVVTVDMDGNVVSWNPMAEQLFGYAWEEAIGQNVDALVAKHDSIRAEAAKITSQVLELGYERVQFTTKRTRKDGSLVDVEVLALPIAVAEERVGFIALYNDITERIQFEEEIRRQKEYFEALFVNSPVAALTVDPDAHIVSWNPMAERLFGYTREEAIGRQIDDLVANDSRVREEALSYTRELRKTGRIQATTRRTRKDGSLIDVDLLAVPVMVAGEEVGFIGTYVDIGELQNARREAEAANQAKSAFLANMSHELRTPLNAILGFTQLMDDDPNLTADQQENLGIINRSGEHLLSLINDVLEMSKIEAGRVALQETRFDLYGLLDGLEEMFRLRAEDKGLTLSFRRAEDVPRHIVTDEGKLRQVLSNLLGNAVKFTREGGVALRVTTPAPGLPGEDGKPTLRFAVEDTGPGISPEDLVTVFEPFVQATSERDLVSTQTQEGTGLGLAISRQFAQLMGGDITVSSELGRGSLFQFDVQVGLGDVAEIQMVRLPRRVLGLVPDQRAPDDGPYRLLVVEDRETNRRLLVQLLMDLGQLPIDPSTGFAQHPERGERTEQGFEVRAAANGQEAIEIWESWEPHLIWMDMRMPVMNGLEATRRIKTTPKGQATVIIALTATAFEEDRERILLEGCDDFVRKPFRKEEIYDMLAKHLGVRFVYEEEPPQAAPARPADAAASPAAALAGLPADWVADLEQATIRADLNLILTLIEQISADNPDLANTLADWAHNYQYKKILSLIEQAGG